LAEFNPSVPQVNDADLEAALNRVLSIIGPMGRLNVSDTIIPVVNMAEINPQRVLTQTPNFTVGEQFGGGIFTAPIANQVLADTGQLAAGTFDLIVIMGNTDNNQNAAFKIEHRDAADAVTLGTWAMPSAQGNFSQIYASDFLLNERLRILISAGAGAGELWSAAIFAKIRT